MATVAVHAGHGRCVTFDVGVGIFPTLGAAALVSPVALCDQVTGTWYTDVPVRRRPARCTASTRARLRWEAPWPPGRYEPPGTAHCTCYSGVSPQRRGDRPPRGPVGRVGARSLPLGWDQPLRSQRVAARAPPLGPRQAKFPDGPPYFAGPRCCIRSATFPKEGASRT